MRALAVVLCLVATGCGLRGDLFLPPEPLDPSAPNADGGNTEITGPSATPGTGDNVGEISTVTTGDPTSGIDAASRPDEPSVEEQTETRGGTTTAPGEDPRQ